MDESFDKNLILKKELLRRFCNFIQSKRLSVNELIYHSSTFSHNVKVFKKCEDEHISCAEWSCKSIHVLSLRCQRIKIDMMSVRASTHQLLHEIQDLILLKLKRLILKTHSFGNAHKKDWKYVE